VAEEQDHGEEYDAFSASAQRRRRGFGDAAVRRGDLLGRVSSGRLKQGKR
jgi:hypothetical protein